MAKTLREIIIEYANTRGGGLPVTPEEMCNALVLWVQQQFSDENIRKLFPYLSGSAPIKVEYDSSTQDYIIRFNYTESDSVLLATTDSGLTAVVKEQWIKDNFFNAIDLSELFEGSDTVVVDINETNDKIEIHLDAEIVNKLQRAILTPTVNPQKDSVPIVTPNGSVNYKNISYAYKRNVFIELYDADTDEFKYVVGFSYLTSNNARLSSFDDIKNEILLLPQYEGKRLVNGYVSTDVGDNYPLSCVEETSDDFVVHYGDSNSFALSEYKVDISFDEVIGVFNG